MGWMDGMGWVGMGWVASLTGGTTGEGSLLRILSTGVSKYKYQIGIYFDNT